MTYLQFVPFLLHINWQSTIFKYRSVSMSVSFSIQASHTISIFSSLEFSKNCWIYNDITMSESVVLNQFCLLFIIWYNFVVVVFTLLCCLYIKKFSTRLSNLHRCFVPTTYFFVIKKFYRFLLSFVLHFGQFVLWNKTLKRLKAQLTKQKKQKRGIDARFLLYHHHRTCL